MLKFMLWIFYHNLKKKFETRNDRKSDQESGKN